jgi:hypothetical protein
MEPGPYVTGEQQQKLVSLIDLIVTPHTPEQLISKGAFQNIAKVIETFPNQAIATFGYECRLSEHSATADFLLCLKRKQWGPQALVPESKQCLLPSNWAESDIWKRISTFATVWADEKSTLSKSVDNVWLEFDIESVEQGPKEPSIFFGPVSSSYRNLDTFIPIVSNVIQRLTERNISSELTASISRIFALLCGDERIFQIGLMLSRGSSGLRLCVCKLTARRLLEILEKINWQGNLQELEKHVAEISTFTSYLALDLDIDDSGRLSQKIGIECYLKSGEDERNLEGFFTILRAKGLSLPQKERAVKKFLGGISNMSHKDWPQHLVIGFALSNKSQISGYIRSLNHVKLVFENGSFSAAKAYLKVEHHWISIDDPNLRL